MVSSPSSPPVAGTPDRKSRRLSMDAVIAADPFMASKMQSVLRRAPSSAIQVEPPTPPTKSKPQPAPTPSRSSTALPPPVSSSTRSSPTSRAPPAPIPAPSIPPSRSVSNSTSASRPPPVSQNYRPSFDGTSDDGHSIFSHSQSGHGQTQTQVRPVYPSAQSNGASAKRERGPPPVAGTPSAYAWRSGQSDDGHGGGSNFYTGGSQTQNQLGMGLPPLPPGAQPPQPGGHQQQQQQKKRTPSNPPVSRVPYPGSAPRRVSVDDATRGLSNGRVSGGPGTWGGVAPGPSPAPAPTPSASRVPGPGPAPAHVPGPTPPYGPTSNPPPPSQINTNGTGTSLIPNGAARPISPTTSIQISGPGFDPYQLRSQPQSQPHSARLVGVEPPRVVSVEPGQIFHHPQVASPSSVQVVSPSSAQAVSPVSAQVVSPISAHVGSPTSVQVASPTSVQVASPISVQVASPSSARVISPLQSLAQANPPAPPLKRTTADPPAPVQNGLGSRDRVRTLSGKVVSPPLNLVSDAAPAPRTTHDLPAPPLNRGRTTSSGVKVVSPPPGQSLDGRQSPVKEGRQSPVKSNVDIGRQSPFRPDVNGRQSPVKPEVPSKFEQGRQSPAKLEGRQSPFKTEGRQSPSKLEGRQSPSKSSPFTPAAQKSTLSVDTTAGYTRTPSTLTPGSTPGRTPVSANASVAANAPSTSGNASSTSGNNTLSTPNGASSARATLSASPARSTLSTSPARATLPTSPAQTTAISPNSNGPSASSARALPFPVSGRPLPASPVQNTTSHPAPFARALSSTSTSSYGTAMPIESEYASDTGAGPGPSRLALGGSGTTLAPINTNTNRRTPSPSGLPSTPRDRLASSKVTSETSTPTSAMMTARMTPTTPSRAAMSPTSSASARASSPITIPSESGVHESSDNESMHSKKRNVLVKTRRLDGANSFRSSEESVDADKARMSAGAGLEMTEDPFARAPPTIVKSAAKVKTPLTPDATPDPNANENGDMTPRRGMPLSPPLSSDDHEPSQSGVGLGLGMQKNPETLLATPALTDNEAEEPAMDEIEDMSEDDMEPESTTPPGSPPPPKVYPLAVHLATPSLLAVLLHELSFRDWNVLNSLNAGIRRQLEDTRALREEVLEYWLRGVGYARWTASRRETLVLSLRDLNAYMRGVSIAVYRYSAIAESFLAVRTQQEQSAERVPGAASKGNLVRALASSCRAYTKVILRLRDQAEVMGAGLDGEFRSPLVRAGHSPLLRVFVPSKEGAWLSDTSVLDCEKELKRAGALPLLRVGDVIWDAAVGDEGNAGRMVWDGNYLVDLDYTYSTTGELPKYIQSFAFSPSYWHKIIRTSNSPLCHIDLAPYAAEIAQNLQLVQDRVQTET
ncbi:hypothetical protein FRC09_012513, partial [Ceratobasidium sp. 395]